MSQYFGWELLFASVENAIRTKEDLMVVVFHWLMIRENYLCVGTGNERDISDEEEPSELLPTGWNEDQENYLLRYLHTDKDLIVMNIFFDQDTSDGNLTISRGDTQTDGFGFKAISYLSDFEPGTATKKKIQLLMPKIDNLMFKFNTLMKPIKEATPGPAYGPSKEPPQMPPIPVPQYPDILIDPRTPFGGLGRGDLDPFGRRDRDPYGNFDPFGALPRPGGSNPDGGMLGTIPNPFGRDQRFSSPRFDPLSPFASGGRRPNPDHFQPPGFGNDDFL